MSRALPVPPRTQPRFLVREVVQTSSMDCGPAALTCVLDGYGISASYGRLREACQTSVDGTSIDTLETVAQQLGLQAEQVMVPVDHVALAGADESPAIAVVQHADLGAHFVVVWRRLGPWVQVMDPAIGRRWMRVSTLRRKLYRHETEVDPADWLAWARSAENRLALKRRLEALGLSAADADALIEQPAGRAGWLAWAALDAAARLAQSMVDAGGLRPGAEVLRLLRACLQRCQAEPAACLQVIPEAYWSACPVKRDADDPSPTLRLRGAVVLRVPARAEAVRAADAPADLPPELAAALVERPEPAWRTVARLLREDAHRAPGMLLIATAFTTGAVALELLLLRGLFDLRSQLNGTGQGLAAAAALLGFLLLRPAWDAPTQRELMRLGRQLDLRLRAALLARLPQLHDRYFQSRPVSDMADRAHGMQVLRAVPHTALGLAQAVLELALTAAGLVWLAPEAWPWALAMAAVAVAVPLASMPLMGERDLRVRTHAAALAGFYLDALLGLVPVRAHRAERAVRREHEALLVEWSRSMQVWIRGVLSLDALQGTMALALAVVFLARHFQVQGGAVGSDLLLVFWTLKVPALGRRLAGLCELLPAQRNALARLLEPLTAPGAQVGTEAAPGPSATRATVADEPAAPPGRGWSIAIEQGTVRAGGHEILRGVDLRIAAGEQVAVVGVSGAGKSSLIGLLLGWHRLAEGRLSIDGRPVAAEANGTIEALRRQIAWVDPAVQLWNRSLLDNLLYATGDEGLPRLGAATDAARVREVAARLPQGLQTLLGEGGGLLSGGEGQRVRLARALLQADPRLVLLDEPFRGLDRPQRQALMAEARRWWQGRTLLCVTHDVGETLHFPRVLVIEDGRLLEDGAPTALAAQDTRYRALLEAEAELHAHAWGRAPWRRLELRQGRLTETDAAPQRVHP